MGRTARRDALLVPYDGEISKYWVYTEPDTATVDNIPTCDDFGNGDEGPSASPSVANSAAASPAVTPSKRQRK